MKIQTATTGDTKANATPASLVGIAIKAIPNMSNVLLTLFWLYLTLGHRVKKTRRAFEKQLIAEGMARQDAQKLSLCYETLKDQTISIIKTGLRTR